jgi:PBSX family phage portal protein
MANEKEQSTPTKSSKDNIRVIQGAGQESRPRRPRHRKQQALFSSGAKKKEEQLYTRVVEEIDPFAGIYSDHHLVVPPYTFTNLYQIYENSDVLQAAIRALIQNVDGFGYTFDFVGNDRTEKDSPEAKRQYTKLKNIFDDANGAESFKDLRKKLRMDIEALGNGALEVVRNLNGNVQLFNYTAFRTIRVSYLGKTEVPVQVTMLREGKPTTITVRKKFRKFAQIIPNEADPIWFKEFGDPRTLDYKTGKYGPTSNPATELLWFKQNFAGYTYGLPKWIGTALEIMGRTSAQYINYDVFNNQGIPPFVIMVSNGILTDDSLEELENAVDSWRGEGQFNRIAVLESVPDGSGFDDTGNAKIELKPLVEHRKEDSMFNKSLGNSESTIRKTFRLPPLYLGGTEDVNRASAHASMIVAEQQVFLPERDDFDSVINKLLVTREFGCDLWKYKSLGPQTTGPDEINRGVQAFSQAGALSVDYAIELANRAFGLEISKFETDWSRLPLFVLQEAMRRGDGIPGLVPPNDDPVEVKGVPQIVEGRQVKLPPGSGSPEAQKNPPESLAGDTKKGQQYFPFMTTKEEDTEPLFTDEMAEFYKRMLVADDAVRRMLYSEEISEDDLTL